ncbi:hypothetical protein [Dactylosporangium matsuzakiense]|uniref:Uncharacterized protein n=1 Tax=Dactylosporangium matsuzakiense TaxID=53360 RepID=A0A9W6KSV6_9ACTN|nr:hypothetical protein [Dactylosporangium matsuzakiense]GLL07546.1 hypothetical protein GCM10017581_093000 [Dactylosporangium matsuzakiense]
MTGPTPRLRRWGVLPDRYADRQVAASTIDVHGRIVALLVDSDANCTQLVSQQQPYSALAVVIDGADVTQVALRDLDLHFPKIDVLGDGFILVGARCAMPSGPAATTLAELEAEIPRNGHIIGGDGRTRTRFHAGNSIGQLMSDQTGNIWTGYSDEASICALRIASTSTRHPANRPPPPLRTTLSTPGLIRWTSAGEPAWYAVFDTNGPHRWLALYALNVGAHRTWAYPYTGFPLVEIDQDGIRCVRRNPVRSAGGVIIADDDVAFIGHHGPLPRTPGHYTVTFARINDGPLEAAATAPLLLPDGNRPNAWANHTICRDNRMWIQFHNSRTWYVLEI